MRLWVWLPICLLGCDNRIEPTGGIFEPVVEIPSAPAPRPDGTTPEPLDPEAFADDRDDEEVGTVAAVDEDGSEGFMDPLTGEIVQLQAPVEVTPQPEPAAAAPAPLAPVWHPSEPIRGDWGFTVMSTDVVAQPPYAVLRFADSGDKLVHPGDLLEDQSLVVMAIGRDAVQVARVSAEGDHAKIVNEIVPRLSQPPMQLSIQ